MRLLGILRRPEAALFALALGTYAYFYQAGGWNQNSRFDLVRAFVEDGSARIDRFAKNTGDKARRAGHYYCDKAPGVSWLAVPPYALIRAVSAPAQPTPRYLAATSYAVTVVAISLPAAIAVVLLYGLLAAFALPLAVRTGLTVAYALGTLAFPYATVFYGHQLIAALLLIAFALLVRARHVGEAGPARLAVIGLVLGYAVAVEYPAALAVLVLIGYAARFVRPWPRLGWLVAGMAVPGAAVALYHTLVFGGPLALPYDFSTQPHRGMGYFMGLGAPDPAALGHILFSSYRGLFYSAPWLLLGVLGCGLLIARPRFRAEGVVCAAIVVLFVWLNASLVDWQGGWAMGARYLVPIIPFLAVAVAGLNTLPARARPWLWGAGGLAAAGSAFLMLVGAAVRPEVHVHIRKPFQQFLLPAFYDGQLAINRQSIDSASQPSTGEPPAFNLGQLLGLDGLASLLPLALFVAAVAGWLVVTSRRAGDLTRS